MAHSGEPGSRQEELIAAVRESVEGLPEVRVEVDGFGHTVFKVGKKTFVMIGQGTRGQGSLFIKSDLDSQRVLIARGPWIRAPYLGQHGWVAVWGDSELDWDHVRDLVTDAYRLATPKRLLRDLPDRT
jgi:predicted DNA-binding protein (MmcQ/YjbR family)